MITCGTFSTVTTRLAVIPWNRWDLINLFDDKGQEGHDSFTQSCSWMDRRSRPEGKPLHRPRNVSIIYADFQNRPFNYLGTNTSMYSIHIIGHGLTGSAQIFPPQNRQSLPPVSATSLAQIMERLGLPKRYSGTINVDICYGMFFTRNFLNALRKRGYAHLKATYYDGELWGYDNSRYNENTTHKYRHRFVARSDGSVVKAKKAKKIIK